MDCTTTTSAERAELVRENMDLCESIARRVSRRFGSMSRNELIGYVYEQLVNASRRWNGTGSFRGYVCSRVPLWVLSHVRDEGRARTQSKRGIRFKHFSELAKGFRGGLSDRTVYKPVVEENIPGLQVEDIDGTTWVEEIASRLDDRSAAIMRLYYLDDLSMTEIGQRLGVSESRVSQLHKKAVRCLRKRLAVGVAS